MAQICVLKVSFGNTILFYLNVSFVGSLSTIPIKDTETLSLKESEIATDSYLKNNSVVKEKYDDKINALSELHELAQFNEIDYFFKLIKEEVCFI